MATSGSGRLEPNNGSYTCPIDYTWTRDANGVVTWKAQIYAIGGGTAATDPSPCWTSFYIRGGNNAQNDLTGNLVEYCASCSQCAQYYQGNILWQHNDVRGGSLTGTINMGTGGGTLKLGYFGQRNGANTSEDYLTWTVDPAVSPPTGLNVTNISSGSDFVAATVSVTGWGVGSGTRYRELQVWTYDFQNPRKYKAVTGDTMSGSITVNNNSSGSLTILPNSRYTVGGYATNGQADTGSHSFGTVVTVPAEPMIDATIIGKDYVTFGYHFGDQGGYNTMYIDYKIGSGAWTTAATITGSGEKSGNFTITGLDPSTEYIITPRVRSSASWTKTMSSITVTTAAPQAKFYCSVNDTAKQAKKIYCSVGGVAKRVTKIYGSVNGVAKLVYEEPNL